MIHDISADGALGQNEPSVGERIFAVISPDAARAAEIVARFAAEGTTVQAFWYPHADRILSGPHPKYEAVILFSTPDEAETDQEELSLRTALADTPVFLVG